jgi:hypothetical protein
VLGATESTLVVGSGGGVEILAALGAGVKHVLALEIDHAIDDIVRRSTGSLLRPEVQLVDAEARSFLAATHQRFDAIVAFHTISNAASSTGGMALAENYLLTEEGIRLLFAHLDDNGVLVISRPEAQLGRLAATCAAAWPFADSIAPHVLAVAMGERLPSFLAALVITRRELSEDDIARLRSQTDRLVFSPKGGGDTQDFLADALAQKGHSTHASRLPYRPASLTPTRDDRPFFNLLQPWNELRLADLGAVLGSGRLGRARLEDLPVAQVAILLLLVEVLLFASPLWALTLWRLRQRGVAPRRLFATFAYFAALGLAYMLLELGLVQELTRLLGMPAHSLVAVLATLLCATGTGSLLLAGKCHVGPARGAMLALVAAVLVGVAVAPIVDAAAPLGFAARIAVAVGVVAIVGFLLGAPFAAGLARLEDPQLVAVAWSANSMASVAGSVAALIISSAVGFGTAALLAAGCYAVAALVGRRHNQPQ